MKRNVLPFGTQSIRMRLIEEADLEITRLWRNRDDARVWFKTSHRLTDEQHRGWFSKYQNKDDDFLFVVESEGHMVGQASVYDVQEDSSCAEIGRFLVAPGSRGKGYMGQACELLIHFCANTLNLKYLFLEVIQTNERAIRLYQRNGFSVESRYDGLIRMGRLLHKTEVS